MSRNRRTPDIPSPSATDPFYTGLTPAGADGRRPYTFDRVVRILGTIAILVGAVWLIGYLKMVLLPFVVAWLIAYILEPFVQYNRWFLHCRRRFLPVMMTLLEAVLLLTLLGVLFVPGIVEEFHTVGTLIQEYATSNPHGSFLPAGVHETLRRYINFQVVGEFLQRQNLQDLMEKAWGFVSGGIDVVMWVVDWFFTLLYVIFIMLDYDNLARLMRSLVPPKWRRVTFAIGHDVQTSMNHYFRGQALVALCVGVGFAIGFSIIGLPLAILMGLFIGILNMVPYLQFVSIVPVTLLCIVYSAESGTAFWTLWWSCIAVYVVVQCTQDLFLTPKIMGKVMGLNPALILLSLSLWGTLLGFIGLIIALPLTTLVLSYYDRYITHGRDASLIGRAVEDPAGD